jgi:predicted RecA/RadA family phage recombinase
MKTFVQPGNIVTLTAPYVLLAGEGALVGATFGVAINDIANGIAGEFLMDGVVTIKKTSALAITQGALVYWDNTNKEVNVTSAGNTKVGVCLIAASNPSATVTIRLNGSF